MTKRYKLPLDALHLTNIRRSDRIPHNRGLGLTRVQYAVRRLCCDEQGIIVRINPNSLIASEKILSVGEDEVLCL
jgi:hypothetical protein